jgi:hypothetical protein
MLDEQHLDPITAEDCHPRAELDLVSSERGGVSRDFAFDLRPGERHIIGRMKERNVAMFPQRVDQHLIERVELPPQRMRAWVCVHHRCKP